MNVVTIIFTSMLMISISLSAQNRLSEEERNIAVDHLKKSERELLKTVNKLSDAQLGFKPAIDSWSIAECVEHLAIMEEGLFGIAQMTLQNEPDSSRRGEVKMTDDQIIAMISSRENKVKTRPETEPKNSFGTFDGSLTEFKNKRKSTISFMKSTKEDLRNRYFEFPFATVDTYQLILFLSAHSVRHTDQIREIMAKDSFPKN